ncbi:Cadherin- member 5 [Saguinus oedipus]|uniref:Cadherin- member 5 n=1 Tax=Saguinus oedipus TaxID=9490 RepID=A0ABQ9T8R7_SAGOE|nr:Cadherin- member 5 [Saguinus oedipus]
MPPERQAPPRPALPWLTLGGARGARLRPSTPPHDVPSPPPSLKPSPLVLRPGPIYAEDGDRGINQRIIYSIQDGNVNGTFVIHPDSGNLTMARSVPSPMTFLLLVKVRWAPPQGQGRVPPICTCLPEPQAPAPPSAPPVLPPRLQGQQADLTRYSVTQVTVRAVAAAGSPPRFPQSLYRGTVALGSGAGVVVEDAAAPSQPLRIQAQDPEFPDLNSAITYRITNQSHFRMEGELVLTAITLPQAGTFYAEVEANNTVSLGTATTVIEIQVSEQEPPSTGEPRDLQISPSLPQGKRCRGRAEASPNTLPGPQMSPPPRRLEKQLGPGAAALPRPPDPLGPPRGPPRPALGEAQALTHPLAQL